MKYTFKTPSKQKETDPDEVQKMNFEFTIIEEGEFYGRKVWQKMAPIKPYPPHAKGKSTCVYRIASAMEGHPITKDEAHHFGTSNINGYIHRQVRGTVKHSTPNPQGKQYSNVESFLTIKKELPLFDEAKVRKENQAASQNTQAVGKPTEQQKSLSEASQSVSEGAKDAAEAKDDEPPF